MSTLRCWRLSEPKAGMEIQCLALAEALGVDSERKHVLARGPWKYLPSALWLAPLRAPAAGSDPLTPPWPDLLISCGRYAAQVAAAIRKASAGRTFAVHIQDPYIDPRRFDLVVVPQHDRLRGPNVLTMLGSLHRITPQRLAEEAARFAPQLAALPRPLVTVVVGGATRVYRFGRAEAEALVAQLAGLVSRYGVGLAVTVSRRTGADIVEVLRCGLAKLPAVLWDGRGENPYFGYLGAADHVLVTCDSVNMTTEACATGKPVYVYELPGGSRKFREFHASVCQAGCTRPFTGGLETWSYAPLDETRHVADAIRARLPVASR